MELHKTETISKNRGAIILHETQLVSEETWRMESLQDNANNCDCH